MGQVAKSLFVQAAATHTTFLLFFSHHIYNNIICLKAAHSLKSKQVYPHKRHFQPHSALVGSDPSLKTDECQWNKILCQIATIVAQIWTLFVLVTT